MSEKRFSGELERDGERVVVHLRGELDDSCAAEVSALIAEALDDPRRVLVIDLSEVAFMDSAGIWTIVETHRQCLESGIELRLEGGRQPAVAQALSLSGVEELMGAADGTRDAAETVTLRLYLSRRSPSGPMVEESVRALAARLPSGSVQVEIIDVFDEPRRAQDDRVIATPTLIKVQPTPELRLIGSIEDPEAVLRHLGLAHLAA